MIHSRARFHGKRILAAGRGLRQLTHSALLLGGFGFGGGVGIFLGKAFDAAGGVDEFLLAGEEGVAVRADLDLQHVALDGRTSGEIVAAGAVHRNGMIVGVNTGFHEAPFCRVRSARLADKVRPLQPRR
jgi:hypothetical protein